MNHWFKDTAEPKLWHIQGPAQPGRMLGLCGHSIPRGLEVPQWAGTDGPSGLGKMCEACRFRAAIRTGVVRELPPVDPPTPNSGTVPRIRIHSADGSRVQLAAVPAGDVMAILDAIEAEEDVLLKLDLDDGRSQVHLLMHQLSRVDVDWQLGWAARTVAKLRGTWGAWW